MLLLKIKEFPKHHDRVWCVCWNPAGTILATCGDCTLKLIHKTNDEDWNVQKIIPDAHQRTIRSVSWSPCAKYLLSASFDSTTSIWDTQSDEFECVANLEGHENEVKSVAWSNSGQFLATCSRDKSVWVWVCDDTLEFDCEGILTNHTQDVKRVLWHPHKNILVSCGYDNAIRFYGYDYDEWSCFLTVKHDNTVWAADFNQDGTLLASCSADQTIKIWKEYLPGNMEGVDTHGEHSTWKCVCTLSGYHTHVIYDISWCGLTNHIATACGDNFIRVFQMQPDCDPNAPEFTLIVSMADAHMQDVNSVHWNPTVAGLLASGGDDNTVKIWQLTSNVNDSLKNLSLN